MAMVLPIKSKLNSARLALSTHTETKTRSRYRPRTEGLFAQIERYDAVDRQAGTVVDEYWQVRVKAARSLGLSASWPRDDG